MGRDLGAGCMVLRQSGRHDEPGRRIVLPCGHGAAREHARHPARRHHPQQRCMAHRDPARRHRRFVPACRSDPATGGGDQQPLPQGVARSLIHRDRARPRGRRSCARCAGGHGHGSVVALEDASSWLGWIRRRRLVRTARARRREELLQAQVEALQQQMEVLGVAALRARLGRRGGLQPMQGGRRRAAGPGHQPADRRAPAARGRCVAERADAMAPQRGPPCADRSGAPNHSTPFAAEYTLAPMLLTRPWWASVKLCVATSVWLASRLGPCHSVGQAL